MTSNTVSEEGIAKINATSKLVLRSRGEGLALYGDAPFEMSGVDCHCTPLLCSSACAKISITSI